jgi:hypothetical protein
VSAVATPAASRRLRQPRKASTVIGDSATTLIASAKTGDTQLIVANTLGFDIGDIVIIGGKEKKQIIGFGSMVIDTPLQHSYASSTNVTKASQADAASYQAATTTVATAPPTTTMASLLVSSDNMQTTVVPTALTAASQEIAADGSGSTEALFSGIAQEVVDESHLNALNGINAVSSVNSVNSFHEVTPLATSAPTTPATTTAPSAGATLVPTTATDTGEATVGGAGLGHIGPITGPCVALARLNDQRSPISEYVNQFHQWLTTSDQQHKQVVIAVVAIIVGMICAWNGPAIWQALFTAVTAGIGAAIVHYEAEFLDLASTSLTHNLLIAEAALVIAYAAHIGFESSQVLFGVALGFWGAYETPGIADQLETYSEGLALLWYTCGAFLGWLVFTAMRRQLLAAMSPLLAGHLVASALGLLVGRGVGMLAADTRNDSSFTWVTDIELYVPSTDEAWIHTALTLLGKKPAASIVLQCGCALVGALLFGFSNAVGLAVAVVSIGMFANVILIAMSDGCKPLAFECPDDSPWRWLLVGSLIRIIITVASMHSQFSALKGSIGLHGIQGVHGTILHSSGSHTSRELSGEGYTKLVVPEAHTGNWTGRIRKRISGMFGYGQEQQSFKFTDYDGDYLTLTRDHGGDVVAHSSRRGDLGIWKSLDERTYSYRTTKGTGKVPEKSVDGLVDFLAGGHGSHGRGNTGAYYEEPSLAQHRRVAW